jgi:hypothetical protein
MYTNNGCDEESSEQLFRLTKKFLAISAALTSLDSPICLQLPYHVENCGWRGFVLQTRDYAIAATRMGVFVHHTTDTNCQANGTVLTAALIAKAFDNQDLRLWY